MKTEVAARARKWKIYLAYAALGTGTVIGIGFSTTTKRNMEVLRIAFPYAKPASAYEPALIHLAPEYVFLENVFSPLVEMSPTTGQIEPGVAQSYKWEGNELHLVIRDNLKTVTGKAITASDAEFSLKRLLAIPGNTHGNFKELLCGTSDFTSVHQSCEGIRVEGNKLILKTTAAGKTFLLPMLVAADFAVIPRESVDSTSLKITDFKNTSGPFYVAKDSGTGEIELRANPNHYHYSPGIPQVVRLVPTDLTKSQGGSLEDFKQGLVDYITTVDAARADEVIAFSRDTPDSLLHTTMNIRSFVLIFTRRGQREIPPAERFAIGRKVRDVIWRNLAGTDGYEKSTQFFPTFGEAALDKPRIEKVTEKFRSDSSVRESKLRMAMVRLGNPKKFIDAVMTALPQIEPYESPKNPNFMKYNSPEEEPQLILSGPDTGFQEDIGLITYSLNAGYFGMNQDERKTWLMRYMSESDKTTRLSMLKSLHESSLSQPILIPLLVAPYAALARKPWKIGLSQLFANNQLWLIRAD
jgi:hypothetical protein